MAVILYSDILRLFSIFISADRYVGGKSATVVYAKPLVTMPNKPQVYILQDTFTNSRHIVVVNITWWVPDA